MSSPHSTSDSEPSSIFENGRLKHGIYKIQNLSSETYLDIHKDSLKTCCRPARDLEDGRGLWEIKSFGIGYTVRRVEAGKPDQFCFPMEGINGNPLFVNTYPVAWRIGIVDDGIHRGYEYVRFHWGPTDRIWDLHCGEKHNGTNVHLHGANNDPCQSWILIPVKFESTPTPLQPSSAAPDTGSLPPYDGNLIELPPTRAQHSAELGRDDFGTIVTITTSRRYRIPDN